MSGIEEVAAVAAIAGAGASVYSASQAGKGIPKAPKLPMEPKLPDTKALSAETQQADIQAKSAGGTILSDQSQNRFGSGVNTTRKTLLGN